MSFIVVYVSITVSFAICPLSKFYLQKSQIGFFSPFHGWPGPYGLRRLFDKLRLRSPVSIYRTTGPLVLVCDYSICIALISKLAYIKTKSPKKSLFID